MSELPQIIKFMVKLLFRVLLLKLMELDNIQMHIDYKCLSYFLTIFEHLSPIKIFPVILQNCH